MDQTIEKLKIVFNSNERILSPPKEKVKKESEKTNLPERSEEDENNSNIPEDEELVAELKPEELLKWDEYGNPYFS